MTRVTKLRHVFVEYLPERLEEGVVYVALEIGTVAHRCCCGCGLEVVTPLSPTDWSLIYNGESVTLHPSIGNWSFPCRSHYWIRNNTVSWAPRWSEERIEAGRERDRIAKRWQYGATLDDEADLPFGRAVEQSDADISSDSVPLTDDGGRGGPNNRVRGRR